MPLLEGRIWDARDERSLEARVHVRASSGAFVAPADAVRKVGEGEPSFYAEAGFAVEVPRGLTESAIERGVDYRPLYGSLDLPGAARSRWNWPRRAGATWANAVVTRGNRLGEESRHNGTPWHIGLGHVTLGRVPDLLESADGQGSSALIGWGCPGRDPRITQDGARPSRR